MDGDTWHRYRLNVGPFDDPPFLLEPYNPPWYEPLWTANGFAVLERYFSKRVDPATVVAYLEGKARDALGAGYKLRRLDPSRFQAELGVIYELSRRIFARNFLYTEISEDEFVRLYAGARALIDRRSRPLRPVAGRGGRRLPLRLSRTASAPWPPCGASAACSPSSASSCHRKRRTRSTSRPWECSPSTAAPESPPRCSTRGTGGPWRRGTRAPTTACTRRGTPPGDLDGGAGRVTAGVPFVWNGQALRMSGVPHAADNVLDVLAPGRPPRPGPAGADHGVRRDHLRRPSGTPRSADARRGCGAWGSSPASRAIVMIPMSIDLYVAMLALLEMGAVAVFVDPWIGRRQIAAFAAFAEPRAWLGIGKSHLLRLLDPRLRAIPIAVTTGWRLGPWPARCSLADLEEARGGRRRSIRSRPTIPP